MRIVENFTYTIFFLFVIHSRTTEFLLDRRARGISKLTPNNYSVSPLVKGGVHWVKNVRIRSFFWSIFSHIWTEYREIRMQENTVSPNAEKYGPEKTLYLDTFHAVLEISCWVEIIMPSTVKNNYLINTYRKYVDLLHYEQKKPNMAAKFLDQEENRPRTPSASSNSMSAKKSQRKSNSSIKSQKDTCSFFSTQPKAF